MSNFIDQLNEAYTQIQNEGVKGTKSDRDKADIDDDGDIDGYEKKRANAIRKSQGKEHLCATKVEHAEWGKGNPLKEQHTLDEDGTVTHYDVMFEHGLEKDVSVSTLKILASSMHEHAINPDKNELQEMEMNPTDHVKKKGDKFCVYNADGTIAKEFDNREDAEKYAIANHDKLMATKKEETYNFAFLVL